MLAQFEEKTYEQHLTAALVCSKRLFFPPRQVLENVVGFDVALRTYSRNFWDQFPHMRRGWPRLHFLPGPGIALRNRWWRELEQDIELFPRYKFNCFIQAKRPNRMKRSDAAEYSCWNEPYYRYNLLANQQEALVRLADLTRDRAIVTYACPAFSSYKNLWQAIGAGKIIQRSNFCEAEKLAGHFRYSFSSAGNNGMAHSESTPIESTPFESALEQTTMQEIGDGNLSFLIRTAEDIEAAAEALGELQQVYRTIVDSLFVGVQSKLAKVIAQLYAFQLVCNIQMLIGYDGQTAASADVGY